jgi:hypothetical protein
MSNNLINHQLSSQGTSIVPARTTQMVDNNIPNQAGGTIILVQRQTGNRGRYLLKKGGNFTLSLAGHSGISNTTWAMPITRDYWWPALKKDVTEYIKVCSTCQSWKNQPNKPKPPLFPISSDTYRTPFTSIAMDFIIKLPISKTYNTILTITDTFSKASILIPCHETIDATGVAQLYANYILPHYRLPLHIISDRDPCFTSSFFRELCRVTGTVQNLSTTYRPQTDGKSEQTNQHLEQYIRIFTIFKQTNWADLLVLAQYDLNSWPNATTKKVPFELLLRYIP